MKFHHQKAKTLKSVKEKGFDNVEHNEDFSEFFKFEQYVKELYTQATISNDQSLIKSLGFIEKPYANEQINTITVFRLKEKITNITKQAKYEIQMLTSLFEEFFEKHYIVPEFKKPLLSDSKYFWREKSKR